MVWWNPLTWLGSGAKDDKGEPVELPAGGDPLTGGDVELRNGLVRMREYIDGMVTAIDTLNEQPPEDKPGEVADVAGWKVSVRNRVLANGGEKAAFLGTLSTAPTVVVKDLTDLGLDQATADALIAERDKMRAAALGMTELHA